MGSVSHFIRVTWFVTSDLLGSKHLYPLSHLTVRLAFFSILSVGTSHTPSQLSSSQLILSPVLLSHLFPRPQVFPGENCPLGLLGQSGYQGLLSLGTGCPQKVVKLGLRFGTLVDSSFFH